MNYELNKEIHYAIHINPFIKHKNIYRPFYKDLFILQTEYNDYIQTIIHSFLILLILIFQHLTFYLFLF